MSGQAGLSAPASRLPDWAAVGATGPRPSVLAFELGLFRCLWLREMLRLKKERTRWLGALGQPILFWLIIGGGMARSFRIPGHEGVSSLTYFFPGMLVMIILFTTIFATISVVEDRQQGFLQSVLVAPGSRLALVAGKVAGVTTLASIQLALFLALTPLAGFHLATVSWAALIGVSLLSCIGLTAMNFTVAWVLDSVQAYHAIMSVVLFPLWFLSGAMFPPPPGWFGTLMRLNPMTYSVDGLRAALSPDALGVPGLGLATTMLVLTGYMVAMLALAVFACRRRVGRGGRRQLAHA